MKPKVQKSVFVGSLFIFVMASGFVSLLASESLTQLLAGSLTGCGTYLLLTRGTTLTAKLKGVFFLLLGSLALFALWYSMGKANPKLVNGFELSIGEFAFVFGASLFLPSLFFDIGVRVAGEADQGDEPSL